jgi:hypothetical protein
MDEYNFRDSNTADHIKTEKLGAGHVDFEYEHIDLKQASNSFKLSGIAEDIDMSPSKNFDPAHEGNPTARFTFEGQGITLSLLLPIEPTDYMGLEYIAADGSRYARKLKWKYTCRI